MKRLSDFTNCPFPGCALTVDHDGDHVPKLRLVQRFTGTIVREAAIHPGYCELGECVEEAAAWYERPDGTCIALCFTHEDKLISGGEMALQKELCA